MLFWTGWCWFCVYLILESIYCSFVGIAGGVEYSCRQRIGRFWCTRGWARRSSVYFINGWRERHEPRSTKPWSGLDLEVLSPILTSKPYSAVVERGSNIKLNSWCGTSVWMSLYVAVMQYFKSNAFATFRKTAAVLIFCWGCYGYFIYNVNISWSVVLCWARNPNCSVLVTIIRSSIYSVSTKNRKLKHCAGRLIFKWISPIR